MSTDVSIQKDEIRLRDLTADADKESITAASLTAAPGLGTGGYAVRVTGLHAELPREKFVVRGLNGSIDTDQGGGKTNIGYAMNAETVSYQGVAMRALSSSGRFSEKAIVSALAEAEIAKGKVRVSLRGGNATAFFPLNADISLSGSDAAALSDMLVSSGWWQVPYRLSGTLSHFSF